MSRLLILHIAAAVLGLVSGVTAMSLRKGSRGHRFSGNVFTLSMMSMAASAVYLGFMKAQALNALVGCLTFYLVATAWLTARPRDRQTRLLERGAFVFALIVCATFMKDGLAAAAHPGLEDADPAAGFFTFGGIALIAAALDLRMWVRGSCVGTHRLLRHLWRMCFPMLIGVVSVVPRLHRLVPKLFSNDVVLYAPIILMIGAIIYWLCRVRFSAEFKSRASVS